MSRTLGLTRLSQRSCQIRCVIQKALERRTLYHVPLCHRIRENSVDRPAARASSIVVSLLMSAAERTDVMISLGTDFVAGKDRDPQSLLLEKAPLILFGSDRSDLPFT